MPSQNPLTFDDGLPAVSLYQDGHENDQSMQSILEGGSDGFKNFLDDNLANRRGKKKGQAANRRVQLIDWTQVTCFYEDSEGDMNVISEDEDITDAHMYYQSKELKSLKCAIVERSLYKQFRDE
jgi:hypothetical protein